MGILKAIQLKLVNDYLLNAFSSRQELADFLLQYMDVNLFAITESGNMVTDVFRLVQTLNQRDMALILVNALRSARPDEPQLMTLLDELELSSASAAGFPNSEFFAGLNIDTGQWRTRLGRLETQVCQVEIRQREESQKAKKSQGGADNPLTGTGLLVGPSHVLTAYHLLELVIQGAAKPGEVIVRFDYHRAPDGELLHPGVEYSLASDWQVAASPSSPGSDPTGGELDFILLHVQGAPGLSPVGLQTGGNGAARGFFTLEPVDPPSEGNSPLQMLVQPPGENLALVLSASPELQWNQNHSRLHYRVDVRRGDSGAPLFDLNWGLVAMHLGQLQDSPDPIIQGVPAAAIINFLVEKGLLEELTGRQKRPLVTKEKLQERLNQIKSSRAAPAEPATHDALWDLREKTAVRAFFDLPDLTSAGRGLSPGEQSALPKLIADSTVMTGVYERPVWMLRHPVRKETLQRLAEQGRLQQALEDNPASIPSPLQDMLAAYINGRAPSLAMQTLDQLEASLQVQDWLAGCVDGLPTTEDVRRATARARMLAPFRILVGDFFRGRYEELTWLRREAGLLDEPQAADPSGGQREFLPLQLYGPGGMGKSTLIAKFLLEHAEVSEAERFPYVYIDFNRQDLNIQDPVSILLEAIDQLEVQYPLDSALWQDLRQEWLSSQALAFAPQELAAQKYVKSEIETRLRRWERYVNRFRSAVVNITHGERPFLLVLDTFEELLYHNREYLQELYQFLLSLWDLVPRFVVLISGRAKIPWEYASKTLELRELSIEDAVALLQARGLPEETAAMQVINMVGRTPLALSLAADLYKRMEGDLAGLDEQESLRTYSVHVKDHLIEGLLYRRILGHIHKQDERVEKLAHPGLVLRHITPDLVLKVLAEPCGIEFTSQDDEGRLQEARELVQRLRTEDSLVEPDPGDTEFLRLRPELRHVMISLLKFDEPDLVRQIHEAAISYYQDQQHTFATSLAALPGDSTSELTLERGLLRARADELYHRLMLEEDPALLKEESSDRLQAIADELGSAISDLPPAAQAYLASRTKARVLVDEDVIAQADLATRERRAATSARNLIAQGQYQQAADLLAKFEGRSADSPLYALQVQALTALGQTEQASKVLAEGILNAPPNSPILRELLLLDAAGDEAAGRFAGAVESLQGALKISTRLNEPLARLQIQLDLYRWSQANPPVAGLNTAAELDALRVVWLAVPDQTLLQDPRLIRSAAAQVGPEAPEIVRRALLLVGPGTIPPPSLEYFASAVAAWDDQVSWENGQPSGMLARFIGAPLRDNSYTTWQEYFQKTPWNQAGDQIRQLVERHPLTTTMAITLADLLQASVLLNSRQADLLQQVIVTGFTPAELDKLASENLGISISAASSRDTFAGQVADLINWAEANARLTELVRGAALQRPNHPALIELLDSLGLGSQQGSLDLNDPEIAIPYYQQALELAQQQADVGEQLAALAGLANAHQQRDELQVSLEFARQAAELARQQGSPQDQAYALSDLGYYERTAGNKQAAMAAIQSALAAAEQSQDENLVASILNDLAFEQRRQGDLSAAEANFQRRLEIVLRLDDLQQAAYALWDLGSIYQAKGRLQEELQAYQQALEYIRKVGLPDTESSLLSLLADVKFRMGEPAQAQELSHQAVNAARLSGNEETILRSLDDQAYLLARLGDQQGALAAYRDAIASADRLEQAVYQSALRISLAYQLLDIDQMDEALELLTHSLEIARQTDEKTQIISSLTALGNYHAHLQNWEEAIQTYQEALAAAEEYNDELWQVTVLGILAGAYGSTEDYPHATDIYLKKLDLARQTGQTESEVEALGELAAMKQTEGNLEEYHRYLELQLARARETGLQSTEIYALYQLGSDALQNGRVELAHHYLDTGLKLADSSGDRQAAANLHFELGRAFEQDGDLPTARQHMETSVDLFRQLDNPAADEVTEYLAGLEQTGDEETHEIDSEFSGVDFNVTQKVEKVSGDVIGLRLESLGTETTKSNVGRGQPLDSVIQQAAGTVGRGELQAPDGARFFTAFLVGPDLILAPQDLLQELLEGKLPPSTLSFRFDFATSESNRILSQGQAYSLAAGFKALWQTGTDNNWLVATDPTLGYALLRLANPAGTDPRGGVRGAQARGWLSLAAEPRFTTNQFALLVHYPFGRQRTIDSSQFGFDRPSKDGRFIGYDFFARPGSEGAPVLNAALEVVAIHRYTMSGDQDLQYGLTSQALLADLEAKNIALPPAPPTTVQLR